MIYFIGTGAGGSPGSRRWRASTLFTFEDGTIFLVDCGVGCHYRLSDKGYLTEIDAVFITHSHMDHFLGLPELLFQAHLERRRKNLTIYAPKIVEKTIEAAAPHLYTAMDYEFEIKPIIPGKSFDLGKNKIIPYEACHWTAEEAYSLKIINSNGIVIGYTGDTAEPCEPIIKNFNDVDILIHEATCDNKYAEVCHKYGHTTNTEAVKIAEQLGAKILILNHIDEYFNSSLKQEIVKLMKNTSIKIFVPDDQDLLVL